MAWPLVCRALKMLTWHRTRSYMEHRTDNSWNKKREQLIVLYSLFCKLYSEGYYRWHFKKKYMSHVPSTFTLSANTFCGTFACGNKMLKVPYDWLINSSPTHPTVYSPWETKLACAVGGRPWEEAEYMQGTLSQVQLQPKRARDRRCLHARKMTWRAEEALESTPPKKDPYPLSPFLVVVRGSGALAVAVAGSWNSKKYARNQRFPPGFDRRRRRRKCARTYERKAAWVCGFVIVTYMRKSW